MDPFHVRVLIFAIGDRNHMVERGESGDTELSRKGSRGYPVRPYAIADPLQWAMKSRMNGGKEMVGG